MHPTTAPRGPISSSAPPTFRVRKKKPGESEPQNDGRLTGPPMQKGPGQGSMFADGAPMQRDGVPMKTYFKPDIPPAPPAKEAYVEAQYSRTPGNGSLRLSQVNGSGPGRGGFGTTGAPREMRSIPVGGKIGRSPSDSYTQTTIRPGTPMMADGRKPEDDMIGSPSPVGGAPDEQDMAPDMDDTQGGPPEGSPAGEMGMPPVIKPESVAFHDSLQRCDLCQYFGQDGQCAVLAMQVVAEGGCNAFEQKGMPEDQGPVDTGAGFSQNPEGTSGAPSLS